MSMSYTICITGERCITCFKPLICKLLLAHKPTKVIFGDCTGVDTSAKEVCEEYKISYQVYFADWTQYGKAAGPIRNKQMIDSKPDLVLAFHTNLTKSKGTKSTIKLAKQAKIPVEIYDQ